MEFALLLLGLLPLVFLHEEGDDTSEDKAPQPAGETVAGVCPDDTPQADIPDMLDAALSPLIHDDEHPDLGSGQSDEQVLRPLDEDDELPDFAVFDADDYVLSPLIEDDVLPGDAAHCDEKDADDTGQDDQDKHGAFLEPLRDSRN